MIDSSNINFMRVKSEENKQQLQACSRQENVSGTSSSSSSSGNSINSRARSTRAYKQKSIFPQKLWQMVNDERLSSAICWTHDGRSFSVDEHRFKSLCLGKENKFFYTSQPKSFVRQLHLYGFRKINKNQFLHPNFKRDHPELLVNIKRTYKQTCLSNDQSEFGENQIEEINSSSDENIKFEPLKSSSKLENQQKQSFEKLQLLDHSIELLNDAGFINSSQSVPTVGALVFANNYDKTSAASTTWYEGEYVDINYNYNEDSILTLYNNDIYPNTCEDNNITL